MITKKYVRKPFFVDAVKVTEENMEEVAEWCSGEVRGGDNTRKHVHVRALRPLSVRQSMAFVGDYVLYAGTGYKVYNPKAFKDNFDPAPEEQLTVRDKVNAFNNQA